MRLLYHYPLCPFSRQIRVLLDELHLEYTLVKEDYWLRPKTLVKLNPASALPVLTEPDQTSIIDIYAIIEYLNDTHGIWEENSDLEKANIRHMISWCNNKFFREVTKIYIDEKLIRLLMHRGSPRTDYLRVAKSNLNHHIEFFTKQLQQYGYLSSTTLTTADIIAASHISIIDYFGEIDWQRYPELKEWYIIIKSRPSFRKLLQDYIPGFAPSHNYAELDF